MADSSAAATSGGRSSKTKRRPRGSLDVEDIITDLLHAAIEEIAASMPYEPGPKIISHDDHGDPVYEDAGLTPRFVALTRKYRKRLETDGGADPA